MNKVKLHWAKPNHATAIARIYEPIVRDTAISFEVESPSPKAIAERIEKIKTNNPYIVAMIDNVVVGYAYSIDFRTRKAYCFTKEATVYVHEEYRKQGIASVLYEKLIEILKAQGVVKVMAVITIPNDKSVRFHEKLGFYLSGTITNAGYKFNQFWDVCFYEKTFDENLVDSPKLREWFEVKNEFLEIAV